MEVSGRKADDDDVASLQQELLKLAVQEQEIAQRISVLMPDVAGSSRARYLQSLADIIGDRPARPWRDEWAALLMELKQSNGELELRESRWITVRDFKWGNADVAPGTEITPAWIEAHESPEIMASKSECPDHWLTKSIGETVGAGWTHKDAAEMYLLLVARGPICTALREGDPRYASATYAMAELFAAKSREQQSTGRTPPTVYRVLENPGHNNHFGTLAGADPAWERLEQPDATGFRGLCSLLVVRGTSSPSRFTPQGMTVWDVLENSHVAVTTTVVAFESSAEDEHGHHAGVAIERECKSWDENEVAFPPNCLFRLKEVKPDGFEAPGGTWVPNRLLVVTATFRSPVPHGSLAGGGGKLCGAAMTLSYGDRKVFVQGFDALVPAKPPLTMAMEFDRSHAWSDWQGASYTLRDEWAYVTGTAQRRERCTPGTRDDGNDGRSLAEFCEIAREHVAKRRAAGCGLALPEEHAYLSEEEVLAVRLYSGPCYTPINTFLRQVAVCSGTHRHALATHPLHTFASTCRHLTSAVRKLAACATKDECAAPLWRGVRGELKPSFWVRDEKGLVCAVDTAFMSTSRRRETPIDYMDATGGKNVLWELHPRTESDAAYHHGADISMLSQFAAEAEVVFPPCTMLVVREGEHSSDDQPPQSRWKEERGRRFCPIGVQPAFV